MKTLKSLLVFTAAFGLSALVAQAGPPSDFWSQIDKTRKQQQAAPAAIKTAAPVLAACPGCKTELVRQTGFRGPAHRSHVASVVVGTKHTCSACEGVVTIVHNKVNDAMQRSAQCGTCCSPQAIAKR